jgi:hypothetical protein
LPLVSDQLSVKTGANTMKSKLLFWLLATAILISAPAAHAQQAGKIFRIGFLDPSTASSMAAQLEAFRQELRKLGWIEGKISASSIDMRRGSLTGILSLRRTWFV